MPGSDPVGAAVLVAFATRNGSTRGVGERIAARLEDAGRRVDLRPVVEAGDVSAYAAVDFGSPVYDGSWPPEAEAFVRENRAALADRPVWLFSVGTFGDGKRVIGRLMTREPRGIAEIRQAIQPREYRVFAGVIERHQWPARARLLFHALGGRLGDNRDWPAIDAWSEGIGRALDA